MLLGFASKPCSSMPWARGLLSASWEWGYPDLPACGPGHGSTNGLVRPIFIGNHSRPRPSRGAKPREADDTKTSLGAASPGWLPRSRDIYARCTSRGSHDVSRDDQGQAGAGLHNVLTSSLVQRGQAQARSTKASSKGYHISATRPRPAGRRSSQSPQQRHHQSLWQAKTTFVRITCTSCLPSKLVVVGSLPAYIWEEDRGLYK